MILSGSIGLRARHEDDVEVLQSELYDDVVTRSRADSRPWLPISPGSGHSPYAIREPADAAACFSVVELPAQKLAGEALLWGVDGHNRSAHLGIALRPGFRGRDLAADVVRALCDYGFGVRGLHRLQIETLSDNLPMLKAATRAGFTMEGTLRSSAWVYGAFADEVIMGQLSGEWGAQSRPWPARRGHRSVAPGSSTSQTAPVCTPPSRLSTPRRSD